MAIMVLKATQQGEVTAIIKDSKGNVVGPADVENPEWMSLEEATVTVTPDATNPLKALVKAVGPVDEASQIQFTWDAIVGEGEHQGLGVLPVVVNAGLGTVVELVPGAITEQP